MYSLFLLPIFWLSNSILVVIASTFIYNKYQHWRTDVTVNRKSDNRVSTIIPNWISSTQNHSKQNCQHYRSLLKEISSDKIKANIRINLKSHRSRLMRQRKRHWRHIEKAQHKWCMSFGWKRIRYMEKRWWREWRRRRQHDINTLQHLCNVFMRLFRFKRQMTKWTKLDKKTDKLCHKYHFLRMNEVNAKILSLVNLAAWIEFQTSCSEERKINNLINEKQSHLRSHHQHDYRAA